MQKGTLGILAHVDSGKTTLSEGLLYASGALRKLGRVDHGDAFLDTDALERERGITIFSKQAMLFAGDKEFTLLDTPGHVDFSAEMERTLSVLDYAVLVISGSDGVQSHTRTLHSPRKLSRAAIARKNVSLVSSSAVLSLPDSESRYRYTSSKYTAYTSSKFVSALTPLSVYRTAEDRFSYKKIRPAGRIFSFTFSRLFSCRTSGT